MKKVLLIVLMLLTMGISTFAQSLSDYVMTTGTDASRWETLTTTTNLITSTGDYAVSTVQDIGFTFNFAGTDYTQFSINSDGNLRLGSTVTGTSNYSTPFSSTNANVNNPKINMLGCDGYLTDSGHVYKEVIGTAPNRVCVIEIATSTYATASRNSLLRWQVQLFETSNEIQIVYPSTLPPILPSVARQPGMCKDNTNIILIDANHGSAFYSEGQSSNQVPTGTWPDVDRYYHFTISNCTTPAGLAVSNITTTDAVVTWTPIDNASFVLQYKAQNEDWEDAVTEYPTDANATLSGLTPNTRYNVRVAQDCNGEYSNFISMTFKTECSSISVSTEPYIEGFEGYTSYSFPDCWTRIAGYSTTSYDYPYISNSTTAHSGGGYLYFYNNAANPIYVALPQFDEDINTLRLSFWMKPVGTTNYYGRVEVGTMTDLSDTTTFELVQSWTAEGIGSTSWASYNVDFDNVTTTGNEFIVIRRFTEGTTTYGWYFDDIKVMPIPACEAPTELALANASTNSVDLFWNPGEVSNFTVYYRALNETDYTAVSNVTLDADSTYTLSGLTPSTNYIWYVASQCSDGSLTASDPSSFATTMLPEDLPYSTDFSADADQAWMLNNGTCTNYWTMGTIPDTTVSALYITTDGTTPGYSIGSQSVVSASKLFNVGDAVQLQISFDVMVGGESSFDYIKLFLAPPTETYPAATTAPTSTDYGYNSYSQYAFNFSDYMSASTSTSNIAYKFNLTNGNTVHIDAIMNNPNTDPDASSTAQVVFVWRNDGSAGTQPGAIISNVNVEVVTCPRPNNLAVSNITATSADVSWDEGDADSYTVEYGPHGFTLGDGTTSTISGVSEFSLTDLTPVQTYDVYVKANCSDGSSVNAFTSFMTACAGITTLPQTWSFDSNLVAGTSSYPLPACWDRIVTAPSTQYPYAYNSSTYAHSGTRCLYFYNYYPNAIGILPNIDPDVLNIQDLQLSFYARSSSTSSYVRLDVGVMTDPAVDSTFTLIQTVPITTTYPSDPYVVTFTNYTGDGVYIAFRNTSTSSTTPSNYYYIDDVTLEEIPTCSKPLYLDATPSAFSANLTWMAVGENFDLYYKANGDEDYTEIQGVNLTDGVYTLTDLTASTTYTWYVVNYCEDTTYTSNTATFTTNCAPETAPYLENFNGGSVLPACWERFTGLASDAFAGTAPTSTTSGWLFSSPSVFGEYHPKVNIYGTGCKYWLVTPEIDLTNLTDPALTFNLALTDFGNANPIEDTTAQQDDKFMVIISTDGSWSASNATVWSNDATADHVYNQISYTGEEVVISLAEYMGQTIRVAFYGESTASGGDNDLHIDNVYVGETPNCGAPSHLNVSQITQTSAFVEWTENGDAVSWTVEYDTAGFAQGTGNVITVTGGEPSTTLTDLVDNTNYDVYVQAICPEGGNSNPTSTSFKTACLALDEIPYIENFDNIGTGSNVHPDCWICDNTYSTTRYPYVYGTNAYNGNADLYFYSSSTTYSIAVLPMVDINTYPMNELQVSFMMRSGTPSSGRMVVGLMTDPSDITTFEAIDTVYNTISGDYEPMEVLFSDYTGDAAYVALKMINLSSTSAIYVDSVVLDYVPSCPKPIHFTVTESTLTSVTLSWDDNFGTSWEIAYGPSGFDPDDDEAIVIPASTNPFEVENLSSASMYQFYVRAICSATETSPWSQAVIGNTECDEISVLPYTENFDSYVTSSTYTDAHGIAPNCWTTYSQNTSYGAPHITSTGTYHWTNSGSNCMVFTCSSAGPDAYAALPTFADPLNTLKLTFWRAMESTSYGELTVGYVTNLNSLATSFVAVATIPSVGSSAGDTISVNFNTTSIPADGNICFHWYKDGTFYSCCIDDIVVTLAGDAPVVTDPTVATNAATAVTQTTATLNATITNPDGVTITAKGFEWKATTGGTYTQIAGTGTGNSFTANLTDLTANTGYTYKAFITFNGSTVYGSEMTFTTQNGGGESCNVPTNLNVSNITTTTATMSWTAGGSETSWKVGYKLQSASQWQEATVQTTSYNLEGLTASSTYDVRVKAICADGESDFVTSSFTTGVGIENITLANSISLMPNPADNYIDLRVNSNVSVNEAVVYNAFGQMVQTVILTDNHARIDLSNMASGMYFVRVNGEGVTATKKFIKR